MSCIEDAAWDVSVNSLAKRMGAKCKHEKNSKRAILQDLCQKSMAVRMKKGMVDII
ncbi:MAG: hypothetical protein GX915_03185 [Clostridiales bacterium]|nr:hypothetical protein [Clostridiales bacterium]